MSYGYHSLVAFSKSEIELDDVAADLLNRLNDERETPEVI
jgi:phosphoribosyl-ATP pyrophosphohydrolase